MSGRFAHPRTMAVAALACLITVVATACSGTSTDTPTASPDPNAVELLKDGKLLVCTHLSYEPFQFKDDAGTVVGFDIDLMNLVATKLGVTQEIVDVEFDALVSGSVFTAKTCDIGAAATTITAERQAVALFSQPYFSASQALLVKKDSGISDLAGLKGRKVGVQADTTGQTYAKEQMAENGYTITVFDDLPTQLAGVLAGRIDGAINDNGVVRAYAKNNPTTMVATEFATGEQYGFILEKDDANATALAGVVNDVLATAKQDGTYDKTYEKWFGPSSP